MYKVIVQFEIRDSINLFEGTGDACQKFIESMFEKPKMPFEVRNDDIYEISIVPIV